MLSVLLSINSSMTRTSDADSKKRKFLKNQIPCYLPPPLGILKIIILLAFITDLPYVLYDTSYSIEMFLTLYNLFIIKSYNY